MDDDILTASWCIGHSPIMLEDTVELPALVLGTLGVYVYCRTWNNQEYFLVSGNNFNEYFLGY